MNRNAAREIEWDCCSVVLAFYAALDEKRYMDLANLFTEDGVWNRLGKDLVGAKAILETLDTRSNWVTAHIVTNVRVSVVDDLHATSVQYVTLYRHEGVDPALGPLPVTPPLAILRHSDQLVRQGEHWRFSRKASRAVMADRTRVTHYDQANQVPSTGISHD